MSRLVYWNFLLLEKKYEALKLRAQVGLEFLGIAAGFSVLVFICMEGHVQRDHTKDVQSAKVKL